MCEMKIEWVINDSKLELSILTLYMTNTNRQNKCSVVNIIDNLTDVFYFWLFIYYYNIMYICYYH